MSARRMKPSYYSLGAPAEWLRFALAALDQAAAAALCRHQWQLARVRIAERESPALARATNQACGRPFERCAPWH